MFRIDVPATSANLGAGFDTLGIALDLHNRVYIEECDTIKIECMDDTPVPLDENNLIYKTVKDMFKLCGKNLNGLHLRQENFVPLARGLGSSSTCIVAGILGANKLLGEPFTLSDMINLAAKEEGHPDNSTPAIVGGLVTSAMEGDKVYYVKENLRDDIKFLAIIPDFEIKTEDSRKAVPRELSLKNAVYSLSRASLMFSSLASGKYENLKVAAKDMLHQPYRLPLISHSEAILSECLRLGAYSAQLSGSGSTLLSIVPADNNEIEGGIRIQLDKLGLKKWQIKTLHANNEGAKIITI